MISDIQLPKWGQWITDCEKVAPTLVFTMIAVLRAEKREDGSIVRKSRRGNEVIFMIKSSNYQILN